MLKRTFEVGMAIATAGVAYTMFNLLQLPHHTIPTLPTTKTTPKAAIVLGGSGSVGKELIKELSESGLYSPIVSIVRKPSNKINSRVQEKPVAAMTPEALMKQTEELISEIPRNLDVVGFSTLGIGAGTLMVTYQDHHDVDVGLNEAFAKGLKAAGDRANVFCLMTAVGADAQATSWGPGAPGFPRYNRVKGEMEVYAKKSGPAIVHTFRPAMILGSIHTPSSIVTIHPFMDAINPKVMKSISTTTIARAMAEAGMIDGKRESLPKEQPNGICAHYPEMAQLEARWLERQKQAKEN